MKLAWIKNTLVGAFALACVLGLCWLIISPEVEIVLQHHRLATYQPVQAHVTDSSVNEYGMRHRHLTPRVHYTYTVNGTKYESVRVFAAGSTFHMYEPDTAAQDVCDAYPPRSEATAWYSPAHPASAFLDRTVALTPYVVALVEVLLIVPFGTMGLAALVGKDPPAWKSRPKDESGWYSLGQGYDNSSNFRLSVLIGLLYSGFCAAIITDLYVVNQHRLGRPGIILVILFGLPDLISLFASRFFWQLGRDFRAPQLWMKQELIRPGDCLDLRFRQTVRRPLNITKVSVGIVCSKKIEKRTRKTTIVSAEEIWSDWKEVEANAFHGANSRIAGEIRLQVPTDSHPSSPPDQTGYPQFFWEILWHVEAKDQPSLRDHFHIEVENIR